VALLRPGWRFKYNSDPGGMRIAKRTYAIAALTLTSAVLRFSFLASKSLWLDEAITAKRVSLPPVQFFKLCARTEMPLYHLVLYGWVPIAGSSEFMLRVPSAFFAVATIPLIAILGTEVSDGATGLLSALLLTVNATSIQYAQDARFYSFLIVLVTLSSIFFVRSLKRGTLPNYAGYLLSGVSSSYVHLFGILILPLNGFRRLYFVLAARRLLEFRSAL
jgi:mannosyltransferase